MGPQRIKHDLATEHDNTTQSVDSGAQPVEKGEYLYDSMATTFPKATLIGLAEATHRDLKVARETECNHSWPRSHVLSLESGWGGGVS